MKKLILSLFALSIIWTGASLNGYAEGQPETETKNEQVELTKEQQAELAEIYEEIFAKKKELIEKYVEFGSISGEKGKQIIERFDGHYKMLQESNYRLPHHHHHDQEHPKPDKPE
jgi:hypothetical protein